jgi:hypothetical protein
MVAVRSFLASSMTFLKKTPLKYYSTTYSMKRLAILTLFLFALIPATFAQESDTEKLRKAIDAKSFEFVARQASGMRGRSVQLTAGYSLQVTPEKVDANLPFFGRAYTATPGSSQGGLKFDFSAYSYEVMPRKKGGWDITIEPTEQQDVRSIFLTIQKTGNASLRITSNSKEGMSYTGVVKLEE